MPARKLPPNEEVIEMYQSGMSTGEIAEACGVKPVTVLSCLSRIGVPRRTAKEASRLRSERGRSNPSRYWLGKKQPPDMVERRVSKIRGEKHYAWKGGKERREYRSKVEKTECTNCCGNSNLCIHHIDMDHYNDAPDNLQVLCVSCHLSLHKTAYWQALRDGNEPPRANGPVGWREGGDEE